MEFCKADAGVLPSNAWQRMVGKNFRQDESHWVHPMGLKANAYVTTTV